MNLPKINPYKNQTEEPFPWLYLDYNTLQNAAQANGLQCELILEGEHYDYLAKLKQRMGNPKQRMGNPKQRMGKPKQRMGKPKQRMGKLKQRMGKLKQRMGNPKQRMENPELEKLYYYFVRY